MMLISPSSFISFGLTARFNYSEWKDGEMKELMYIHSFIGKKALHALKYKSKGSHRVNLTRTFLGLNNY